MSKKADKLIKEFDKVRVAGELSDKLHLRRNYGKPLSPNAKHQGITLCLSQDRPLQALKEKDNPYGFDPARDRTSICAICWAAYQRIVLQDMGRVDSDQEGRLVF